MKKILKIVVIVIVAIIVLIGILMVTISRMPSVPEDYTEKVKTGGEIEAKYLSMGPYEVDYKESLAMMSFKKYEIYYPTNMKEIDSALPVVVFVNGTGAIGSKYPALQKHLASWGFITIATEEEQAWYGFSAEMSVRYLELLNGYEKEGDGTENPFYQKIDLERVGITGHSQGGFGVVNAITEHRHHENYKAAVILSSNAQTNEGLQWEADATKIQAPTMILASTGNTDSALASLESIQTLYDQIPDDVPKVLARRTNADHGEMLYSADGYVTAWFCWLLQGDEDAAKAFVGEDAELLNNSIYQDQRIDLGE